VRGLALALVFLGGFAVFLVAGAPLSVALRLAHVRERGIDYAGASGSVWRGVVRDVRVARQPVGDVEIAVVPAALLHGALGLDVSVRGAVRASGSARLGLDGSVRVRDASLVMETRDLARLHPAIAGRGGEVFVRLDEIVLDRTRACARAQGVIRTDVLTRGSSTADWKGPPLEGAVACADGALTVALRGAEDGVDVSVDGVLNPQGGARVHADVETESPDVAAALLYLGFQESPEGFSYAYVSNAQGAS
jgi:hypothetical protein